MPKATRGQRILIIGLLTISLMTPPIIMGIAGQTGLASAFVYGGVIAIVAAFYGLRLAVILSAVAGVAGTISALLNPHPIAGAIFFGLFTGACALSAKQGLHSPALMVPIFISFVLAAPPEVVGMSGVPAALMTGAVLTLGGLWATGSARLLLGHRHLDVERKRLTTQAAVLYAITMTLVLGIATWGVLTYAKFHQGAWLLLTLIIVLQPSPHDTLTRSLQRLGGTMIGGIFAFLLILAGVESTLALVVGGVILFAALTMRYALKRPYWEYVTVLTPAAILLNTPGLDAVSVAEDRVAFTIIATVVGVAVALAIKVLITQWAPEEETT